LKPSMRSYISYRPVLRTVPQTIRIMSTPPLQFGKIRGIVIIHTVSMESAYIEVRDEEPETNLFHAV